MAKNKQKTRKAASKRFKVTGTGKLLHRSKGFRHLRGKKGKRKLRRLKMLKETVGVNKKKLMKMLGRA